MTRSDAHLMQAGVLSGARRRRACNLGQEFHPPPGFNATERQATGPGKTAATGIPLQL
ncbi:MAG TPA: hypothetical protein VHK03_04720 [Aestuariivirgaceae bacterium]|nr:hypothetical protein [Aestuariivirgaceae bacterium]